MSQEYKIDDIPRTKSPKPNSMQKRKPVTPDSPDRKRERKIEEARAQKNKTRMVLFEPQSSDSSSQAPTATKVLVQRSPFSESLRRASGLPQDEFTAEEKRWHHFILAKQRLLKIQGMKKEELNQILLEHFPDCMVQPQGLMDIMGLSMDPVALQTVATAYVEPIVEGMKGLQNINHKIDISDRTSDAIDKLGGSFDKLNMTLLLVAVIIIMRPTTSREKILVGFIVVGFIASKSDLMSVWQNSDLCNWLRSPVVEVQPQSLSVDSMSTMIVGLMNSYVFLGAGKSLLDPVKLAKVIQSISRTDLAVGSVVKTVHLLTSFVHSCIDHYWNGNPWFLHSGHAFVDEFLKEAGIIITLHEERKLLDLQSSLDRVRSCITLGENVSMKIPGSQDTVGLRMQVNNTLAALKNIKKMLLSSNFQNAGLRQEPATLLLRGPPGVGKSQAMQHIAHAINALTLSDEDFEVYLENPGSAIHNRAAENVYWDGYKQSHNIVFMDDLLQPRDIQGNPDNEIMNTIRAVNIHENTLHCAEITSKGNTTFRSKFLIGNTNAHNMNIIESINEVGAFMRRWHVVVDVIPRSEYCQDPSLPPWKRRFNPAKLEIFTEEDTGGNPDFYHLIGHSKIIPEMCEYHVLKMDSHERNFITTGEVIDFKELVLRYYQAYVERCVRHEVYLKGLDQRLQEYRQLRNPIVTEDEHEVTMEEVEFIEPQMLDTETINELRPTSDFEWVGGLTFENRRVVNGLRNSSRTEFDIIDSTMKYLFFQSETLGGMLYLEDAFNTVHEFYGKHGYGSSDLFPIFGVSTWTAFFDHISSQIYVMIIKPKTLGYSQATRTLLDGIALQRTFIEENKISWAVAPTWVSYLHRLYSYTLAHAVAFGRRITFDPLGQIRMVATYVHNLQITRVFYANLIQLTGTLAAFKVISYAIPYLFPMPKPPEKTTKDKVITAAHASDDPVVVESVSGFEKAKVDFKAAEEKFLKMTAHLALEKDSKPESDERHNRPHKVKRSVRKPTKPVVTPQSLEKQNRNLADIHVKIRNRNVFQFLTPIGKESKPGATHQVSGYALAVKGRCLLFPYHFLSVIDSNLEAGDITREDLIVLRRTVGNYEILKFRVGELLDAYQPYQEGEDRDLVMVELPPRFQPVPDITKFVAPLESCLNYKKFDGLLSIPGPTTPEVHQVVAEYEPCLMIGVGTNFEPYNVKSVYKYHSFANAGDCGSLLFVNDKHNIPCLVGMHVAGAASIKIGFSTMIDREFLDDYVAFLDPRAIDPPVHMPLEPTNIVAPNMYCVGQIPSCKPYPRAIGKSKIVLSHIAGLAFPLMRFPAQLRPFWKDGVRIDPNELALRKYCQPDTYINDRMLVVAIEDLYNSLVRRSKVSVVAETYSYQVAVLGDDSGYWTSIPRSTSSGYPWNCMSGPASKTRFWGTADEYDLENPEAKALEMRVREVIAKAMNNVRSAHYFTDSLKDERRSKAKVDAGITRLISCCPVDLLIAFRMYFGAFQKWLVANRIENGYAIGVNEHSSEWNLIAMKLDKFGDIENKEDGDQAGFDTNHRNSMSIAVLKVVELFYGDSDPVSNRVRHVLWAEIINSIHLNEGAVYEWFTALPSGAPPTTFFNCTANQLLMRTAWYTNTYNVKPQPLFDDHVYLIVLGDDNLYCVDPGFVSYFNGHKVAQAVATLGYTYTPADKTTHSWNMKALSKTAFLKRGFRFDREFGRYVAPLDMTTICDMINWQRDSSNSYADCEVIISTALDELVYHGKQVYNSVSAQILEAVAKVPALTPPRALSYHQRVSMLKHREEQPVLFDVDRFSSGYECFQDSSLDQMEVARLEEQRGLLFSNTVRTPRWQPHSSPGFKGNSTRLVHRVVLNRTANTETNKQGNILTDSAPPGQTDQGLLAQTRGPEERSQQTSDTTKSTVDADTPVAQIQSYRPLHPSLLDSARTGVSQDVAAFLAKPISVASGNFTTSDTYATFVWTSDGIPQSLLYAQPLWLNKLAGNMAFRGTMHLSLQVNATRFQQGRYILGWVPSGGATQFDKFRRFHTASLCLATQTPHVELDINCDSEATLIIPYVTAQGWATLDAANNTFYGNNGSLFLAAYEPLGVSTGTVNCSWQLFCHFEDVEFCMPVPQSRANVKTRVRRKVRTMEMEQESQDIGPISAGFSTVSKAASSLSAIPFISSVAGPLSWATDIAARVASAFGWSRPHNSEHAQIIQRFVVPRFTNADVSDNSQVLATMDRNGVEELPGFAGSDLDEMSLSYLTSISAFYRRALWLSSQAQGTLLFQDSLSPRDFATSNAVAGITNTSFTPMSFFSNFFALYRGSIRITIKLVKTEFHTGRLMVAFQPYERAAGFPLQITAANSAYTHREIIDVRLGNEFTLEFPYMSSSTYRSTVNQDAPYGLLTVFVLNTLEAPPNVPADIVLLVEAAAGKDFELAQPCDMSGNPTQIYTPQSGTNVCEIVSERIGGSEAHEDLAPSRLCIGERITSIRQLLKRFSNTQDGDNPDSSQLNFVWNPYSKDVSWLDTDGLIRPHYLADTYVWFSSCFALERGGIRLKIIPQTNESLRAFSILQPFQYNSLLGLSGQNWSSTISFWVANFFGSQKQMAVTSTDISGGVEVQVPFFHRFGSLAIGDTMCTRTAAAGGFDYAPIGPVPRNLVITKFSSIPAVKPLPYRAISEDSSFGMFVSTPLVTGHIANYLG